ncbi:uncharacterized protein LOC121416474 [Lytechinus variegatus]|uniref:uncharacterized protein LOC121416474 n=1 Tax=Lytechinus variegatus TaxID=7654 RepID=UPI001BB1379F|nr:uncharacterized protein LOC121416474 [Lytechinus variegatus]
MDQDDPSCLQRLENWTKGDTGSWSYLFLGLQEIERPELAQKFAQEVSSDVITRLRSIPTSGEEKRSRKKRRAGNQLLTRPLKPGAQDGIQRENTPMMRSRGNSERRHGRSNAGRTHVKRKRLRKQETGLDTQANGGAPRLEVNTGERGGVTRRQGKGRRKGGAKRRTMTGKMRGRSNQRRKRQRGRRPSPLNHGSSSGGGGV